MIKLFLYGNSKKIFDNNMNKLYLSVKHKSKNKLRISASRCGAVAGYFPNLQFAGITY